MTKQNPAFFLIFACLFEMLRRRKREEAKRPGLQQQHIAALRSTLLLQEQIV